MAAIGKKLSAWLRGKMAKSGYSSHGLAVMCGLTHPTILAYRSGKIVCPDLEILAKIAGAFGLDIADAVTELDIPKIEPIAKHPRRGRPLKSTQTANR